MTRRRYLLGLIAIALLSKPAIDLVRPAYALIVFDPSNYAENVLTAARSLEQINNQIQSLQNQATMLQNMARNLQRLDFSSLSQLTGSLQRIDGLMEQAGGLSFDLGKLQDQWRSQYPESYDASIKVSDTANAARGRWQNAMQAFRQTMGIQSQIVENVRGDRDLLSDLVNRSRVLPVRFRPARRPTSCSRFQPSSRCRSRRCWRRSFAPRRKTPPARRSRKRLPAR
ncbi:P-type conjugative transfer protein TrbJ [Mesorhizobium amorphae]|uniref:P-type conjugative transfer protein TrbJ n=1 Tax=Mesorhizobium amorphae TaxID=71433 RepID=UPI0021B4278F|nr:P-type conjugative transfer protein TrbJ [Mesorhizobium amorphae]